MAQKEQNKTDRYNEPGTAIEEIKNALRNSFPFEPKAAGHQMKNATEEQSIIMGIGRAEWG